MKKIIHIIITITFLALLNSCTHNSNDDIKKDSPSTNITQNQFSQNSTDNEEEQAEFTVILESFDPAKKMDVIKAVKAATGLGLKEAMAIVTGAPQVVKEGVSKADADKLIADITAAGGKVSKK
ncbi:bL12 family ribosomal protein [uncultured Treponema sp.]|uniref:bL12 family ribosomal protein n=1 Tax=uncultured Treponema sp. TaxID=162155 RepID=UPI0025D746BE|nr:bL12 family ribosomal protein [uncultured Treponema sp.]